MKARAIMRIVLKRYPERTSRTEFSGITPDDERFLTEDMKFTILGNGDLLAKIARWEDDHSFIHVYPHDHPDKGTKDLTSLHVFEVIDIFPWPPS